MHLFQVFVIYIIIILGCSGEILNHKFICCAILGCSLVVEIDNLLH